MNRLLWLAFFATQGNFDSSSTVTGVDRLTALDVDMKLHGDPAVLRHHGRTAQR